MSAIAYVLVPYEVFTSPAVSPAAKLLYSRLKLYGRRTGVCNPTQETLAREMRLKPRQIRNLLSELKRVGWVNRHRKKSRCYYHICGPDLPRDTDSTSLPNHREGPGKIFESGQPRSSEAVHVAPAEQTKDPSASQENHTSTNGQWVDQVRTLLADYRGVRRLPDREIANKILAHLGSIDQVKRWLDDFDTRVDVRNIRSWGFYVKDACSFKAAEDRGQPHLKIYKRPDPGCPNCGGSGFIIIERNGYSGAQKCGCAETRFGGIAGGPDAEAAKCEAEPKADPAKAGY